jgi:hypothetical protein
MLICKGCIYDCKDYCCIHAWEVSMGVTKATDICSHKLTKIDIIVRENLEEILK